MTARTLPRAALALLIGTGLAGCSAVVDPTTGALQAEKTRNTSAPEQESAQAAPEGAVTPAPLPPAAAMEMDRLKRENQALNMQQAEAQARLDALTNQMAREREEQRRFREMMTTNFDLLEQSVAKSLADNIERGGRKPGQENKKPIAGPAMTPPAASESSPSSGAAPPQPVHGPAALQPLPHWDDTESKRAPTGASPSAQVQPRRPEASASAAANGTPAAATGADAAGSKPSTPPAVGAADKKNVSPPAQPTAAPLPVPIGTPGNNSAVFRDPDLEPPANPRALKAHPEAKPLYEKGFVYFAKGNYEESNRVYKNFLARFPDDQYSDNAQFWIGEAHLQLKQLDQADAAYREVLRNYAHKSTLEGYKTPDAIYKLGQISLMRNQTSRAEYYFRNAMERFPDSTAGQKAQRELDAIRVNTAAGTGEAPRPDS